MRLGIYAINLTDFKAFLNLTALYFELLIISDYSHQLQSLTYILVKIEYLAYLICFHISLMKFIQCEYFIDLFSYITCLYFME